MSGRIPHRLHDLVTAYRNILTGFRTVFFSMAVWHLCLTVAGSVNWLDRLMPARPAAKDAARYQLYAYQRKTCGGNRNFLRDLVHAGMQNPTATPSA